MSLLNMFKRSGGGDTGASEEMAGFLSGYSIEVMPRTAAKIEDFRAILPAGTRVYIAHIDGTPIEEMVETAKRITDEGFPVMPHFPARIIKDRDTLEDWIKRYVDAAGINQALLLGGGVTTPHGDYDNSMQLMETGLFDKYGFKRLHIGGHPEGNKDIDPDGSTKNVDAAVLWKQGFSERTDAEMAIATQFAFESQPVIEWAERLKAMGVTIPIHVGIAGPTKLQTLIKFAIACGVGPSLRVLQRRAMDLTKLMVPFEPTDVLNELAAYKAQNPDSLISQVHVFPLGGIKTSAEWCNQNSGSTPVA